MASANEYPTRKSQPDPAGLRAILENCRFDLDKVRRDVAETGSPRPTRDPRAQEDAEVRLSKIAERLNKAADVLERISTSQAGSPLLQAEILLREADHRIRNNLQSVATLLRRQAAQSPQPEVRAALQTAIARIEAVARVHLTLQTDTICNGRFSDLDLGTHLTGLCTELGKSLGIETDGHAIHVEVEPLAVSRETSKILGLIVVELVTNAVRHAFAPGRAGTVRVIGSRHSDRLYRLSIEDNGKGLPSDFDLPQRPSSLGLWVVGLLTDQLRGHLTMRRSSGAQFTLCFPVEPLG